MIATSPASEDPSTIKGTSAIADPMEKGDLEKASEVVRSVPVPISPAPISAPSPISGIHDDSAVSGPSGKDPSQVAVVRPSLAAPAAEAVPPPVVSAEGFHGDGSGPVAGKLLLCIVSLIFFSVRLSVLFYGVD